MSTPAGTTGSHHCTSQLCKGTRQFANTSYVRGGTCECESSTALLEPSFPLMSRAKEKRGRTKTLAAQFSRSVWRLHTFLYSYSTRTRQICEVERWVYTAAHSGEGGTPTHYQALPGERRVLQGRHRHQDLQPGVELLTHKQRNARATMMPVHQKESCRCDCALLARLLPFPPPPFTISEAFLVPRLVIRLFICPFMPSFLCGLIPSYADPSLTFGAYEVVLAPHRVQGWAAKGV